MTTIWPDEQAFHANLVRVVHLLLAFRQMTADQLADRLGKSRSTIYAKLKTGRFTALEVQRIAELLKVRVEVFYHPADRLFAGAVSPEPRAPAPELGVVPPTSSFEQMALGYPTGQRPTVVGDVG